MSKRIITIGRQFGSNGRLIGIALAERLGINCYDKDLIKLASEHTDIPYDQLKLVDEKREKPWRYQVDENSNIDRHYRYGHIDEILFNLQSKIIKEMASKEDCIIVGRCGNYVLRDEERCKNIYLYLSLHTVLLPAITSAAYSDIQLLVLIPTAVYLLHACWLVGHKRH